MAVSSTNANGKKSGKRSVRSKRQRPRDEGPSRTGVLNGLGIVGFERIEPVILAPLVSGEPLLLIGPHGTGKSYLLSRISEALGLVWRHYNASLLNYDDLVGYPLPDDNGSLRYVQTPASIWGAEAVFIDEISRCRPDLQNKLFPIIHERRVQGILLDRLVYRWSAMNPPATDDDIDEHEPQYLGSEPLDPALADRFAFVVPIPDWDDMTDEQQERVIRCSDQPATIEAIERFRSVISAAKSAHPLVKSELADSLPLYIRLVSSLLAQGGIRVSPRRAAIMQRNIIAVHSVRLVQLGEADLADSAYLAISHSLPHAATGMKVDAVKVLASHREAWKAASLEPEDPRRYLMLERDPVRRVALAITIGTLSREDFSGIVADTIAELPLGGRHAVVVELFESNAAGRLVAAVADQCGEIYGKVAGGHDINESVGAKSGRHRAWQRLEELLAAADGQEPDAILETNLLTGLFASGEFSHPDDVDLAAASWRQVRNQLKGVTA